MASEHTDPNAPLPAVDTFSPYWAQLGLDYQTIAPAVRSTGSAIAQELPAPDNAPPIDHTTNKPWRDGALGYQNIELEGDDGRLHIHPVEDIVWAAFKGPPPEGWRVSFLDGNPANCRLDNLVLLSPEEAKVLDAKNVGRLPASARSDREREQPRGLTLLEGYVDPAFIDNGYAVILRGTFECAPKKEWRFDFGLDLLEAGPGKAVLNGGGLPSDTCASTGDARYAQSRFGLSIEAAMAVGPLRAAFFHPSTHEDVLNGLRGLRKLIVGELRKAVLSRDAVFTPKFAEWIAQHLPSPEDLLQSARKECENRKDDPAIAHLLDMSTFDDSPTKA
jgi:hypothetical protein